MRLVTPEVKDLTSPSTRLEKPCTLPTTEAANDEPGMVTLPPEVPALDTLGIALTPPPLETGRYPGS